MLLGLKRTQRVRWRLQLRLCVRRKSKEMYEALKVQAGYLILTRHVQLKSHS